MHRERSNKIIMNGTEFCHECAVTRTSSRQNENGGRHQKKPDDLSFSALSQNSHPKKADIRHNYPTLNVKLRFTFCEWFVIVFGAILLGLYIFTDFLSLSGFTRGTMILSMFFMVVFFLCGFICVAFALVETEGRRSTRGFHIKSFTLFKLYNNKYLRSSVSENILNAEVKDYSPCKKMMIINGTLIFIFCLVMSGLFLFGEIDYGYEELNFLNSLLVFLFFLLLGHLYLAFSFIIAETSGKSLVKGEKA